MINDIYYNPTKIYFGKDTEHHLSREISALGCNVLLVYGQGSIKSNGLYNIVVNSLKSVSLSVSELSGVMPNPRSEQVYQGISLCRENNIDVILAVGGGSVIDTAKAISLGVNYHGDFFDFFLGKATPRQVLPIAAILTTPGAGSESNSATVITNERLGVKAAYGNTCLFPVFSILNPEHSLSLSKEQTIYGVVDAISHIMERYFTNTTHVDCTDGICESLIKTLINNVVLAVNEPENYDYRAEIMWAAKLAHDNTAGFGRKQDWSTHKIAHEIGARFDLPHGAILAVLFPAWMEHIITHDTRKLIQLGERVFDLRNENAIPDRSRASETINTYRNFIKKLGLSTTLRGLGVTDTQQFDAIGTNCVKDMPSGTIGNFVRLNPDDIVRILHTAY